MPVQVFIFQQNMALLPPMRLPGGQALYRGLERYKAIDRLLTFLKSERPAITGLSEMWVPDERKWLCERLAAEYPHLLDGPRLRQEYLESGSLDSGLLLLSRFPIIDHHESVYPDCLGEDCWAQKGIIHARVALASGHRLDLFLTHLQNPFPWLTSPNKGPGQTGREKVWQQLDHLRAFVSAYRDPNSPALLMGDLNTDGCDKSLYADLRKRLVGATDQWLESGNGGLEDRAGETTTFESESGITFDDHSTFADPAEELTLNPIRHRQGQRLDYFLSYGSRSLYCNTRIIRLESSPGRDISDHYGLMIECRY